MTTIEKLRDAWGAAFQRPPHPIFVEEEGEKDEEVTIEGHVVYRCDTGWGLAVETYTPSYAWDAPPDLDLIPVGEWATLDEAIAALATRPTPDSRYAGARSTGLAEPRIRVFSEPVTSTR